jgi:hypothetical protein
MNRAAHSLALIAALTLPGAALAQEETLAPAPDDPIEAVPTDPPKSAELHSGFGLGFAAGATSGIGVAYRQHFDNGFGLQLAGIGFGGQDNVTANAGVNVMYTFARVWLARFYAVAGSMLIYTGQPVYDWSPCAVRPEDPVDPNWTCEPKRTGWQNRFMPTVGAGIGMEFHFTRNIGLALELPLSLWMAFDERGFLPQETRVWPIPNASLVFYF